MSSASATTTNLALHRAPSGAHSAADLDATYAAGLACVNDRVTFGVAKPPDEQNDEVDRSSLDGRKCVPRVGAAVLARGKRSDGRAFNATHSLSRVATDHEDGATEIWFGIEACIGCT